MPLDFQKKNVNAGEPVTADGWNAIVDGLFEAQAVLKTSGGTVQVQISNPSFPVDGARVIAFRTGAAPAQAIAPISPSTAWSFPMLDPGTWTVRAEAPGWSAPEASVTVSSTGVVTPAVVTLGPTLTGAYMPDVLGKKLPAALTALGAIQLRIVDSLGKDLPAQGFDADYNNQPVIVQRPAAGELVPVSGTFIVVAAVIKQDPVALVPDLFGRTFEEARTMLEAIGLHITVAP
jgi:hypothetical protein